MGYKVEFCGICDSKSLLPLLDMGMQPLAERESDAFPLRLVECANCGLVQLDYVVDQQDVFPDSHPYATGNTSFLREHFGGLAHQVAEDVGPGDLVIDVGANDGTFLKALKIFAPEVNLLGVEPTNQALKMGEAGIPYCKEFFNADLATELTATYGRAKYILASNVLAHVPDAHDFVDGVWEMLSPEGTFITENHNWASVVLGMQIDTVYHEHLRYYSVTSLGRLLEFHDFVIEKVEMIPTHGGSFRTYGRPQRGPLGHRAKSVASRIRSTVAGAAAHGPVYGVGAATRATPLIYYTGIAEYLTAVSEPPGSQKIGTKIPGTNIPVVSDEELVAAAPGHALLLNWHIAPSVTRALRDLGYQGKFIIPLPEPRIFG